MASFLQRGRTVGEEAEDGVEDGAVVGPGPGVGPVPTVPSVVTVAVEPAVPRSLGLRGGDEVLEVSWSAPVSDGGRPVTGYVVQWRTDFGSYGGNEQTAAGSPHTVAGLVNGTRYWVRVAAVNEVGRGGWSAEVDAVPVTVPGRPERVAVERGDSEVWLSWWRPGDDGGSITGYVVQWRSGTQDYSSSRQRAAASSPFVVAGLTNGTAYWLRVAAENDAGRGEWSDDEEIIAVPARVPAAPGGVTADPLDGSLAVWWHEPDDGGLSITGYVVQWKSGAGLFGSSREATPKESPYTVTGLTNGTAYQVRVAARNEVGLGGWSDDASGTPRGVPGAPGDLAVARGGSGKLAVSWSAPSSGSAVTGYEVQWRTRTEQWSASRQATLAAGTLAHTVTGLTNGTAYQVRVAALAAGGGRTWSLPVPGTPAGVPAKPGDVLVQRGGSGELVVSWDASGDGGSAISGYVVQWKSGAESYSSSREASPTGRTHTVTGLTNGAEHRVRVAAVNQVGQGAWSSDASGTPAARPDAPGSLSAVSAPPPRGDKELELEWSPPSETGGFDIARYVVQWRSGADQFGTDPAREATISPPFADPVTHSLTSLKNGTEYSVRVAAVTRAGQGDWSDTVSATPYGRPRAPNLNIWYLYKALAAQWTPHSDTGGLPVAGYRLQWKSGNQEFVSGQGRDISVTSGLDAAEFLHTVDGLTPGTEYTFRVWAYTYDSVAGANREGRTDAGNGTPRDSPGTHDDWALRRFVESTVELYEDDSPWVRTIWNYIILQDRWYKHIKLIKPEDDDSGNSILGITYVGCNTHTLSLRDCYFSDMEITAPYKETAEVVLHELAHAYLMTTGLHSDDVRDALGVAWLFFHDNYYDQDEPACAVDLFVDALVSLTMDSPTLRTYPSEGCTTDTAPSSDAVAMVQSVLDGEASDWLAENYCTATTAWAKVKSASGIDNANQRAGRNLIVYNMQGLFGGYESERVAAQAGYVSDSTETNPWNHSVCTIPDPDPPAGSPGAPGSFTLASGSGQITATWAVPADTGTSAITGYELQWRLDDDAYDQTDDSTRKADLGASTLSRIVTGLDSERYAMRVRAVNDTGAGAWSAEMFSQPS